MYKAKEEEEIVFEHPLKCGNLSWLKEKYASIRDRPVKMKVKPKRENGNEEAKEEDKKYKIKMENKNGKLYL